VGALRGGPYSETVSQALLAFVTNFQIIGIAYARVAGLSVEPIAPHRVDRRAHSHDVVPESFDAGDCAARQDVLLDRTAAATPVRRFRCYGRGPNVYTPEGSLVASFSQEGMIRALAPAGAAHGSTATL